ncbi:MAG: hypothetical protein HY331_06805 [Chloroflexi bacterium]|nr:hypothetical protein [Chloroflexota bacterium]
MLANNLRSWRLRWRSWRVGRSLMLVLRVGLIISLFLLLGAGSFGCSLL